MSCLACAVVVFVVLSCSPEYVMLAKDSLAVFNVLLSCVSCFEFVLPRDGLAVFSVFCCLEYDVHGLAVLCVLLPPVC